MKADPQAQLRLLELADLDTALDRMAHRRTTLPELAEIGRLETRLVQLRDAAVTAETEIADLTGRQTKTEADVDQVRSRSQRDQQRMDSGMVSAARDVETLQSEIASLHRRQSELEDEVLDLMERREAAEQRRGSLTAERDEETDRLRTLTARRDAALAEIDEEAGGVQETRVATVEGLPAELLALYEKLRAQYGVGAAALKRRQCEGCKLQLSASDLGELRAAPADEVRRCPECRRILVRTPESGL